jgi:signal transduction histidine kinase/CheY-like chemotaxis protein/HPt (histidine-containing phosphotransfer) domain-containing protein
MIKNKFKPLYLQIIFTVLAFAMMVTLGYTFISRAARENILDHAMSTLSLTEYQIEAEAVAAEELLRGFSHTVYLMILNGQSREEIQQYFDALTEHVRSAESKISAITGFYAYIASPDGGNIFYNGLGGTPPEDFDFDFEERPWFIPHGLDCGAIFRSDAYIDAASGEFIISFSRCLHLPNGERLGIFVLDMSMSNIGDIVINTALREGGYGTLAAGDLVIIAHDNTDFVGKSIDAPDMPLSVFWDTLSAGEEIYEESIKNWRGEEVIVFSRHLPNGLHIILLTPTREYFAMLRQTLLVQCILGVILSLSLIIILVNIDRKREQTEYDLNSIKKMEQEIRRTAGLNQAMLDNMPVGMAIFDKDLKLLDCNVRLMKMFKADRQYIINNFLEEFSTEYQPDNKSSAHAASEVMSRAIKGETLAFEWLHQTADGEPVPCHLTLTSVADGDEILGICFTYDLREIKKLTRQLEEALRNATAASEAKGVFLSSMSHEMRTPLNTIMGMASLGRENSNDIERKNYSLEKIEEASAHLLNIINDVLDMSKIEAGKLELVIADFSFESALKKSIGAISLRLEQKQQEFYVTVDGSIPQMLAGDEQRLSQVIINLLSNAVKFTPEGGCIRLNASLENEDPEGVCTLAVEVSDTGIGVTPEQKLRLFDAFEQAESGISRTFGGTGLGLTISKRIVEMMGGRIGVESEAGKGSAFRFSFKAARGGEDTQHLLSASVNWENVKILAVDDSPEILSYFTEILKRYKLSCDVAKNGLEALELIKEKGRYDVYFVDWKMPGMDGIELTRHIKESNQDKKSVVIMISSTEWGLIHEGAAKAGVDKFLMKPLFASDIMDCMNACMGVGGSNAPVQNKTSKFGELKGCRILLAEDVKINREILLGRMKFTEAEIDCAENGKEVLRMLDENPDKYDLIFMDVQMPEMDGLETTRRIRFAGNQIAIIAMTANVFKEDIDQCLASGMNDHVGKPLDLNIVMEKVRKYWKGVKRADPGIPAEGGEEKKSLSYDDFLPYVSVKDGLGVAGEKELYVMLLNLFREENLTEELVRLLRSGSLGDIEQCAHKLKGTTTNLGLTALFETASKIEADAKNGVMPESDFISEAEKTAEKTVSAIDAVREMINNE